MNNGIALSLVFVNIIVIGVILIFSITIKNEKNELLVNSGKEERNAEEKKQAALYILVLDITSILFIIFLISSFTFKRKKCCVCCSTKCIDKCFPKYPLDSNTTCRNMLKNCFALILYAIIYLVIWVFSFSIYLALACGQHILRIFSAEGLILFQLSVALISILIGKGSYFIIIAASSFTGIFCNLLGMFLPFISDEFSYNIRANDNFGEEIQSKDLTSEALVPPSINNTDEEKNDEPNMEPIN